MATGGINLSKEFFELIKAIGESKSKQEEDRIIQREVQRLKAKLEQPQQNSGLGSKKRAKEFLCRLLYVEMLGHDASFGWIRAVELSASASLFHKRTGYLVCGACLPPTHEFRFMLVNQIQRDLQSTNVLETSGGLVAATQIITADMVPAVAPEVVKLLAHDSATIRKKAIILLHRFHVLADEVVSGQELQDYTRKALCDKEPSVMGATVNVIHSMSLQNPAPFKDLVPSLVSILKQINEHRLPTDYDYHRVPAPWIQLIIVRTLGVLGRADVNVSKGMYEILHDTMKKADNGINAGYAIVYECIKTIVAIYPNNQLLDAAGDAISRFMASRSHNLKYLAVTGLALIVESHPQYAAQHQMSVMDCLEDPDETLQRKTLDLLYRMTNPVNVEFIAEKLVAFIAQSTDMFLKQLLTQRVCSIAERYAPNNAWYIRTVTHLFEVSGDMVATDVAQNLMSLIAEGTGESDEADMLLRQNAVELYVTLLHTKEVGGLPRILLETMAWCLGEYGYLSHSCTTEDVLQDLCNLARVHKSKLAPGSRRFLLQAIAKLVAQVGTCPPHAAAVMEDYTKSRDYDLQQRCLEFQNLLMTCPHLLPEILPVDASAEDVQVDEGLSFLNGYVQEALANGAAPYSKPEDDDDDDESGYGPNGAAVPAFNMTPYAKPENPQQAMRAMSGLGAAGRSSNQSVSLPPGAANGGAQAGVPINLQQGVSELSLNTRNVANRWGKGGLNSGQTAPAPAPTPPPTISSAWDNHSAAGSAAGGSQSGSAYGGRSAGGFAAPAPPPPPPQKTAEQLERERQAAALFGGVVPGQAAPTPASAPVAPPPPPKPPASAPAPPPPPPADFDLLDMGGWDGGSAPMAAPPPAIDVFAAQPAAAPASAPVVETVSEDDDDEVVSAATPAPAPADDDPFASAGLLGDMTQPALPTFETSQKFEYQGNGMAPLKITTPQFGEKWGSVPATVPVSVTSSKVQSLSDFMKTCETVGAHPVEAIAATNEGISAGMIGGTHLVLLHGKVSPGGKVDVTIKTTDQDMASSLALYLQTMLR